MVLSASLVTLVLFVPYAAPARAAELSECPAAAEAGPLPPQIAPLVDYSGQHLDDAWPIESQRVEVIDVGGRVGTLTTTVRLKPRGPQGSVGRVLSIMAITGTCTPDVSGSQSQTLSLGGVNQTLTSYFDRWLRYRDATDWAWSYYTTRTENYWTRSSDFYTVGYAQTHWHYGGLQCSDDVHYEYDAYSTQYVPDFGGGLATPTYYYNYPTTSWAIMYANIWIMYTTLSAPIYESYGTNYLGTSTTTVTYPER